MAEVKYTEEEKARMFELQEQYEKDPQDSILEDLFKVFDRDNSGYIELAEAIGIWKAHNGENAEDAVEEGKGMIEQADTNHDGKVDLAEFIQQMKSYY